MPRTIEEGFRDFLGKLRSSGSESAAASSHRASIKACLEANFTVNRFWRTGSFGNGTSIYGYSDVDYFVSLAREQLKANSETSLRAVRDVLDRRFPNTGVRVNCPAVKVPFGIGLVSSDTTEIVPADYLGKLQGTDHSVYEIPNCAGGWMRSSPDAHNAYVSDVDQKLGGKVKPLVRFIKAWKFYQAVPISSFYLEIATAAHSSGESSIENDIDVYLVLNKLQELQLQPIKDPVGVSTGIPACKTEVQRQEALSKLQTAVSRAAKAVASRKDGHISDAFEWWQLFYGSGFPSYYY